MNIFKTTSASNRLISAPTVGMITVVAWLFFGLVNPTPASSIVVIAGAVILAACFYAWLAFIIRLIALFWPFSIRSQRHLAGALTLLATFMILMQSIGELSWRDVLAIVPLVAILYVYVGYFARPRKASSTA